MMGLISANVMTGKLLTISGTGDTGKQSDLCRQADGVWAPAPLLMSERGL